MKNTYEVLQAVLQEETATIYYLTGKNIDFVKTKLSAVKVSETENAIEMEIQKIPQAFNHPSYENKYPHNIFVTLERVTYK